MDPFHESNRIAIAIVEFVTIDLKEFKCFVGSFLRLIKRFIDPEGKMTANFD